MVSTMHYKNCIIFIALNVIGCLQNSLAQILVREIKLDNLLKMQQGLGWPHALNVSEGHEALIKLDRPFPNAQYCIVTTNTGVTFDISSPPTNRFERWGAECGLRIKNVAQADEGRWRLNATRGHETIAGWTEIYVENATSSYTGPDISLQDGTTHANIELTSLENSYCLVAQPFSESSLISGQCNVVLDRATRAVQGSWSVLLGIPGRVEELHVERRVAVEAERLDVGYVHDSNTGKLHLYCNILHTEKNITFCRFQKTSSSSGYNVMDGLSDGVHSYYGEGFLNKQCGITIEHPTVQDYGTWRCSVGVQQWVDEKIHQQTPMQALISVSSYPGRLIRRAMRADNDKEISTVFVQDDESFTIMCRANVSLTYCWFQHPNGSQFTPVPIVDEEQPFWYTGQSLQFGDCGIVFSHATKEEEGEWTCHMGPRDELGVEVTDRVNVRVTGPLAANLKYIAVTPGDSVTLDCHSSNGHKPLDYCRFLTPRFLGLSVNPTVTEENSILGRFYFTPGKSLDYGDCSLTISNVHTEDVGEWTCAALISEHAVESRDSITVSLDEAYVSRVRAGVIGMVVGVLVVVIILAGYVTYKKLGWPRFRSRGSTPSAAEILAFDGVSTNASRSSAGSDESTIMDRAVINPNDSAVL